MKTIKLITVLVICLVLFTVSKAQVGINSSATNPDASAILDLNSGNSGVNKGFLTPQVALTNISTAAPVISPAAGLMVYSTSAPIGGNGAGYYYWNGSIWANLNNTVNGIGTLNYVAVWTPNATTLGIGLIQDNGFGVGVNVSPVSGVMLNVNSFSGIGVYGKGSIYGGQFIDANGDYSYLADSTNGYGINAEGITAGGYFSDGTDYARIGWMTQGSGISATGINYGGDFTDAGGDFANTADNTNHRGVYANGTIEGGYFSNNAGDYSRLGFNSAGNYSYGATEGGLFSDAAGDTAYVAYNGYGILSNRVKSTMVKDMNNQNRVLFCNESPEVLFEDYGEGQLVNGKAHITLDSVFAMNVTINEKHPLRVFIQLENNVNCEGVIVTDKTSKGFDVVELKGGTSNTPFEWHIIANRSSIYNNKGELYDYSNMRLPKSPAPPTRH